MKTQTFDLLCHSALKQHNMDLSELSEQSQNPLNPYAVMFLMQCPRDLIR